MTLILVILGGVTLAAVLKIWWEVGTAEIAIETHDQQLMEDSTQSSNTAGAVLLVCAVVLVIVAVML